MLILRKTIKNPNISSMAETANPSPTQLQVIVAELKNTVKHL
jgi:hypothetical protein